MSSDDSLKITTFPVGSLGCNCSLLYSPKTREAIAIDPGNDAQAFMQKVSELGITIKYLLHTHAHFDHIGHSDRLRQQLNSPIMLHKDDLFLYKALRQQGLYFGEVVDEPGEIDHFIEHEEEFSLRLQQDDSPLAKILSTIHTPGHTPGSCSFYTECLGEPMLFTGDTLFANSIGRTDLPGGNQQQLLSSIKQRLLTLPDETTCVPGHGRSTSIFREKKSNPFLS